MKTDERILNMVVRELQRHLQESDSYDDYRQGYKIGYEDALNMILFKLSNKDY